MEAAAIGAAERQDPRLEPRMSAESTESPTWSEGKQLTGLSAANATESAQSEKPRAGSGTARSMRTG